MRNLVLGHKPADFDLATDAPPEVSRKLFRRTIPTGIQHGTVTLRFRGENYEVTTFRVEGDYSDARRPDSVTYTGRLEDDLSRRDFTMNAMALSIPSGELIDPFDGRGDIRRRLVRAIGNPERRFSEDALRLMRGVRFATTLDFQIEDETLDALVRLAGNLSRIAAERIRDEFVKILTSSRPARGLEVLYATGLLAVFAPELAACRGQDGGGEFDLLDHLRFSCEAVPEDRLELRLAALLHDIGKPASRQEDEKGGVSYHGHEERSALMAEQILDRLRFPNAIRKSVLHLIRMHMFAYDPTWSDAAVRRFLRRVGTEYLADLLILRRADAYGKARRHVDASYLDELQSRAKTMLQEKQAIGLSDLAVNGRDLMTTIGIPPGRRVGTILEFLLEAVTEDPAMNRRERLLEIAGNFYRERMVPSDEA